MRDECQEVLGLDKVPKVNVLDFQVVGREEQDRHEAVKDGSRSVKR